MRSAEAHTLVELDAQPLEGLDDIGLGLWHKARGVGVFNAEHQVASVLTCKQVVVQSGAYAADMQRSRRTGGKSHPDSSF